MGEIMLVVFFLVLVGFVILLNYRNNLVYNVLNKRLVEVGKAAQERIDQTYNDIMENQLEPSVSNRLWDDCREYNETLYDVHRTNSYFWLMCDLRKWKYEDFFPNKP